MPTGRQASVLSGRFIVFEGLDGAGKSKQARALLRRLKRRGLKTILVREPGGTALGRVLRGLILQEVLPLSNEAELLLIAAARAQLINEVVRPWLAQGGVVVADRFTPSTWAYQGAGRGLPPDQIAATVSVATGGIDPDLVVLLDVPPELGLLRKGHADGARLSRFETETPAFAERVRRSYLDQASAAAGMWLVLDGRESARAISGRVWETCQTLLKELGKGVLHRRADAV